MADSSSRLGSFQYIKTDWELYNYYKKVKERDNADFRNFVTFLKSLRLKMVTSKIFHEK